MPGAGRLQRAGQPVQLSGARGGSQAPDDAHRKTIKTAGQRTHCQQAGRIGPPQVIQAQHHGPGQHQLLHQVGEGIHHTEPQNRVAGHRDRAQVPGPLGGQQPGDGRPPRFRR